MDGICLADTYVAASPNGHAKLLCRGIHPAHEIVAQTSFLDGGSVSAVSGTLARTFTPSRRQVRFYYLSMVSELEAIWLC
jgi:hypothetical protein